MCLPSQQPAKTGPLVDLLGRSLAREWNETLGEGSRMAHRLLALAAGMILAASSWSQVTAAGFAPTADQLGKGEAELSQWWTSETNRLRDRWLPGGQLLLGLHDRIEFGVGTDYASDPTIGMKFSLWRSKDEAWAVAGGFTGVRVGTRPTWYGAARYAQGPFSLHLGGQTFDGEETWFAVGLVDIGDRLTLGVDHSFGPWGQTAASAWFTVFDGFSVFATGYFPNDRTAPQTACFGFAYGFRL